MDHPEEAFISLFGATEESGVGDEDDNFFLKYDNYERKVKADDLQQLRLALIAKHHSLWAEYIYNAARLLADLIDTDQESIEGLPSIEVQGMKCLELGAGAGLPGLISALNQAKEVVISDYGNQADLSLIYPIDVNIEYIKDQVPSNECRMYGAAYTWGYPVHPLIFNDERDSVPKSSLASYKAYESVKEKIFRDQVERDAETPIHNSDKFDVILLADLIFNRSQHSKLLETVKKTLKHGSGKCYVSFSHHDPQKRDLDLNFFKLAREDYGLEVTYVGEVIRPSYPFRENDGLDDARGHVYLYTLQIL